MFEYAKHGYTNSLTIVIALYSNGRVNFATHSNSTVNKLDEWWFQRLCYSVFIWKNKFEWLHKYHIG